MAAEHIPSLRFPTKSLGLSSSILLLSAPPRGSKKHRERAVYYVISNHVDGCNEREESAAMPLAIRKPPRPTGHLEKLVCTSAATHTQSQLLPGGGGSGS